VNIFEEIYEKDIWGFGSGHGSLHSVTKGYIEFLEQFMLNNGIKNVVDYGCGDWQFSKHINWDGINYHGFEVVESLVETNNQKYGQDNITFSKSPKTPAKLPAADLLLVKDVLQHLDKQEINDFIELALPKFKYALITNNRIPENIQNMDVKTGEFRPLDLRKKPYNLKAAAVYSFGRDRRTFSFKHRQFFEPWEEIVLLVTN
jgi:2-polyprenyl-3-methyl-5-hydroxy-6-metoxy-1,4-benzoquinol methylase